MSKEFDIDSKIMDCILELIEKGKIAKPIKLFKDCAPKLDTKGIKKFMYLDMGQRSYFLLGAQFPVGTEIKSELAKIKKELPKAKEKQKAMLEKKEFFLQELDKINTKIKGHASGLMKFEKAEGNICYMAVKTGVKVSGKTKKGTLADDIKNIGYDLKAKNGQIMQFIPIKEEKEENQVSDNEQTTTEPSPTLSNKEDTPQKKQDPQWAQKKLVMKAKMTKMKEQLEKLKAQLA